MTIHRPASAASPTRAQLLAILGWSGLVLFAVADVASNGSQDLLYAAVIAGIAAAMAFWIRAHLAPPALVISAALGSLVAVAQSIYVLFDISHRDWVNAAVDGIGLVAGLSIALGSVVALAKRRVRTA